MDLPALAAAEPVNESGRDSIGSDDTRIDGAQVERCVRHWPVQPSHHIHICIETCESAKIILVHVGREVAVHEVARQGCNGAQDDLVRQTLERVVITCCVSGVRK